MPCIYNMLYALQVHDYPKKNLNNDSRLLEIGRWRRVFPPSASKHRPPSSSTFHFNCFDCFSAVRRQDCPAIYRSSRRIMCMSTYFIGRQESISISEKMIYRSAVQRELRIVSRFKILHLEWLPCPPSNRFSSSDQNQLCGKLIIVNSATDFGMLPQIIVIRWRFWRLDGIPTKSRDDDLRPSYVISIASNVAENLQDNLSWCKQASIWWWRRLELYSVQKITSSESRLMPKRASVRQRHTCFIFSLTQ